MSAVAERPRFFSPKTLADELRLSERTVRQMLADGTIPSYKVGGARRVSHVDLDEYLVSARQTTTTKGSS